MTREVRKSYERDREQLGGFSESRTTQAGAQDTDINKIVERFTRTGKGLEPGDNAQYADVSELNEDLTVLINKASMIFNALKEAQNEVDQAGATSEPAGNQEGESPPATEVEGAGETPNTSGT